MSYKSLLTTFLSFFCFSLFSQVDTIPPDVHCLYGIRWIVNTEQDSISIDTFVAKDSYSLEELARLKFSFSSDVNDTIWHYECKVYWLGVVPIEVWVTDEFGNQSFCETFVAINFDNSKRCTGLCADLFDYGFPYAYVETLSGYPLKDVEISRFVDEMLCEKLITNESGETGFLIDDSIIISKKLSDLKGVSTLDVILIGKHVLGIDPINSPLELLAADVDNSGDITIEDAQLLARIITGDKPLDLLQWKFIPRNYRFSDWTNPFKDDLSDFQSLLPELPDNGYDRYDIIGVKLGDVNGSYNPELD